MSTTGHFRTYTDDQRRAAVPQKRTSRQAICTTEYGQNTSFTNLPTNDWFHNKWSFTYSVAFPTSSVSSFLSGTPPRQLPFRDGDS
jgi:hypothetical protein